MKIQRGWRHVGLVLKEQAEKASAELKAVASRALGAQELSQWERSQLRGILKALGRPTTRPRMEWAIKEAAGLGRLLMAARQQSPLPAQVTEEHEALLQDALEQDRHVPLATLTVEGRAEVNLKRRLAQLVLHDGYRLKEALAVLGLPPSKLSWGRRVIRAVREGRPLHDQRPGREIHSRRKRTPRMREAIWSTALALRGATVKAVASALAKRGTDRLEGAPGEKQLSLGGDSQPSYSTIYRELQAMPVELRLLRKGGRTEVHKHGAVVGKRSTGHAANVRWEIDHTRLDVWCRRVEDGTLQSCEVWITAIIDTYSRRIMSVLVNDEVPTSWTVIRAVKAAIRLGGKAVGRAGLRPDTLVMDNGKDLTSERVHQILDELGITRELCRPHDPNAKGKIERWMRTVTDGFCGQVLGGMVNTGRSRGAAEKRLEYLHDVVGLAEELRLWVNEVYNEVPHSRTGASPHAMWLDHLCPMMVTEEELDAALLPIDSRKVTPEGIHYSHKGVPRRYVWPEQQLYVGQTLALRFDPDEPWRVSMYQGNRYIGEAIDRDDAAADKSWAEMMARSKAYRQNATKLGESLKKQYEVKEKARLDNRPLTIEEQLVLDNHRRKRKADAPVEEPMSEEETKELEDTQAAIRKAAAATAAAEEALGLTPQDAMPGAAPLAPFEDSSEELDTQAALRILRGQSRS